MILYFLLAIVGLTVLSFYLRVRYVKRTLSSWQTPIHHANEKFIDLGGQKIYVRECGPPDSTQTVVFLHGIFDSSEIWRHVEEDLTETYQVRTVSIDFPGFGRSEGYTNAGYSYERFAEDVSSILEKLGHKHVLVVGHSMGGGVAQWLAYKYPDLVRSLLLVAPVTAVSGKVRDLLATRLFKLMPSEKFLQLLLYCAHPWIISLFRMPLPFVQGKRKATKYHNAYVSSLNFRTEKGILCSVSCAAGISSTSELTKVAEAGYHFKQSCILIGGKWDKVTFPYRWHQFEKMRKLQSLPIEFIEMKATGHMIPVESPQTIVENILKLLLKV